MSASIQTDDFKDYPYWWERTPRPEYVEQALPASTDVVIVGSGYTGLSAAIQTCQHGLHTVVVDSEDAGWGCSSRNGGQVSPSLKPEFDTLARQYGPDAAYSILKEGLNAVDWIETFIAEYRIDCNYNKVGRFHGAHTPKALETLRDRINRHPESLNVDAYIVEAGVQSTEVDSDFYHGGAVFPHHAALDPARYHEGMREIAKAKGAEIISHCRVQKIEKSKGSFSITTGKGTITANDVIVATSGYTGNATPWQQKRIIPIGTYMIATEPLPEGLPEKLIVNDRVVTDTLKLVVYYRTCPERRRILFGGRVSLNETDPKISAPRLHGLMVQRFPDLRSVKVSHSWMGFVGYTFDEMPHLGVHDGVHYCMGYCGAGITLASYLGMRVGQKVAGQNEGATGLDDLRFQKRFYYRGNPWFLAPSIYYYRWRDQRTGGKRSRRA